MMPAPGSQGVTPDRPGHRLAGFTLIEVLVVVAIMALLIGILMPSLAQARTQAKIAVCKANSKQIGTSLAEYQVEYSAYVPLIFNYWSNVSTTPRAAENCWLSVALRRYNARTRDLLARGVKFDPKIIWPDPVREEYETRYMPEFFTCPFQRGKAPQRPNPITENIGKYVNLRYGGRWESYHTWLHTASDGFGKILKGTRLNSSMDSEAWYARYPTVTFNLGGKHRKWEVRNRTVASVSASDWTAVYCGQGEFTPFPESGSAPTRRANMGSHFNSGQGGTNAIFADTHVEWIPGKYIGRP